MQTTIKQVSPVEYELEITATAEDLAPDFTKALREQRGRTHMKGFRPGKVPLSLVKKMYGKAVAYTIADKWVQEAYEDLVLNADEHDVLGQPKITTLDYEMDSDLHAVVQFGVRPEVDVQDLSGETVEALVHEVTDEEIDEEIGRLLEAEADLIPLEDEPIEDGDLVVFDLQEVDAATRAPLIGKRDEDQQLFLDDPRLDDNLLLSALKDALLGKKAGDTVPFHFEHDKAHDLHTAGHDHAHFFEATVKEAKRRDVPDLDDEFVKTFTQDRLETVGAFREEVERQLKDSWERKGREFLEENIVTKMLELHPVPVPESVIEVYLDSYVEDVKRRGQGQLPENFAVEAFRQANRPDAERQARWMLVRDAFIKAEALEVTDEDIDAFFEKEAAKDDGLTAEQLRQFYQQVGLLDSLDQRLIGQKVFDALAERFEVVEKDAETIEREREERHAAAVAEAEAAAAAAAEAAAVQAATEAEAGEEPEAAEADAEGADEGADEE